MAFNPLSPEWPKQLAELVESIVGRVRSLFTVRAVKATNAVVFGLVAVFAGMVAAVLGIIVGIKAVQAYVRWDMGSVATWIVGILALFGVLVLIVGAIRSSKAAIAFGVALMLVTGARWALDAGDVVIDHDTAVWISYLAAGGLFLFVGAGLMVKRHSPVES